MSPEAVTRDRIYSALKRDYWEGRFRPMERIDIRTIADRYIASPTPVREALSRLVGERIFEHRQEGGFQPMVLDPPRLASLYRLHRDQLLSALAIADRQHLRRVLAAHRSRTVIQNPLMIAHFVSSFFGALGEGGAHVELRDALANQAERLLLARLAEASVLHNTRAEAVAMVRNGLVDVRRVLARRIEKYHERRIAKAQVISDIAFG